MTTADTACRKFSHTLRPRRAHRAGQAAVGVRTRPAVGRLAALPGRLAGLRLAYTSGRRLGRRLRTALAHSDAYVKALKPAETWKRRWLGCNSKLVESNVRASAVIKLYGLNSGLNIIIRFAPPSETSTSSNSW